MEYAFFKSTKKSPKDFTTWITLIELKSSIGSKLSNKDSGELEKAFNTK
jgi:hypothetical protein